MRKKQKQSRHRTSSRRTGRKPITHSIDRTVRNQVLAVLYFSKEALSINDLVKALDLPRSSKSLMEDILSELCYNGSCYKSGKKQFALSKSHLLAEATVSMSQSGFGFATELQTRSGSKLPSKDPFISASRLHSARHGDRVLVTISAIRRDGRSEADVIRILERSSGTLAGFYRPEKKHGVVDPENPRFPFSVVLAKEPVQSVRDGDAVLVRLIESERAGAMPRGEIIEVFGNPADYEVQVRLVMEKFNLPHRFSEQALDQAGLNRPEPPAEKREDLRDIEHITIDGEHARDFDDAIAVKKLKNGYRLYVSIADVSAYIRPGSDLDQEAYERGTSVYFPKTVIPMLPEGLSNNLCSLLPDTDRLTVTAILDFDRQGGLKKSRFSRSVIRSRQRFTYDTVEKILVEKDAAMGSAFKPFLTPLKWAGELARSLQQKRMNRGAIGFTIPEAEITFNENDQVVAITKASRHFSHQIIEEFMLAANEAVAQRFAEHNSALLYRIHEQPSPEKIKDFVKFAETLGLELPRDQATPEWYNQLITLVKDSPHEYIVNNLLLRTMQQARYSPENKGHFGLATDLYCHFTSPIRRYPDLIVHRLLCQLIDEEPHLKKKLKRPHASPAASLGEDGTHLSDRERTAIASERDMAARLKRQFLAGRIGDTFKAVISGVASSMFFVELLDTFISGSVSLTTMEDDYYILDEKKHRFVGDISGRVLQIGDLVEVVLLDVDQYQNRIEFTLKPNT